jgi:hypothetical protein
MANVGPTKWYVDSVAYNAVSPWSTGLVTAASALIRPTAPNVGSGSMSVSSRALSSPQSRDGAQPRVQCHDRLFP